VEESLWETSRSADGAIAAAFGIAGAPAGFAVLAVGRLGSSEFDLLSDADLIFVCEESADRLALIKATEQMVQVLSAYTRDGMVFPVDGRLRPHGSQGELLMCPTQFETYFAQEAQPWEALMYSKARWVAGSQELANRVLAARDVLFQRMADDAGFAGAVHEMRARLDAQEERELNLKTSPGGAYDLDFLSAFLLIRHHAQEKNGSLRTRLARCTAAGWFNREEPKTLDAAAELLRTVEHIVRLVVGRARKSLPATEHARLITEKLTAQILGREFPEGLLGELELTQQTVRAIFQRYIPAA
jgi:glutamate-ammonia-ligase adenylyltransferase